MRKGVVGFKENLRSSNSQTRVSRNHNKEIDENNIGNNNSNDNHNKNGNNSK